MTSRAFIELRDELERERAKTLEIRKAYDEYVEARQRRCSCSGAGFQIDGCTCGRKDAMKKAEHRLKAAAAACGE